MTKEQFYASLSPANREIARKYGISSPEQLAEITALLGDFALALSRAFAPVVKALNEFIEGLPETVAKDMGLKGGSKLEGGHKSNEQ